MKLGWFRSSAAPRPAGADSHGEADRSPSARAADVCFIVEGTYPFVMGGVSSWVHGLVRSHPELTFRIWHIAADVEAAARPHAYELPANVLGLHTVALRADPVPRVSKPAGRSWWIERFDALFGPVLSARGRVDEASAGRFARACSAELRAGFHPIGADDLLRDEWLWERLTSRYSALAARDSFSSFFWTWHNALEPLLSLIAAPVPPARCFHAVSTGYAGWVGARAAAERSAPLLLTEHGIYTKERRIELGRATWIVDRLDARECPDGNAPYFRSWWVEHFTGMSSLAYAAATEVLTIHRGNTGLQLRDGAEARKLSVIPNGVDVEGIAAAVAAVRRDQPDRPFTVGFIGRITPIKDVIMLLDAAAIAARSIPGLEVRVMGPSDEDAAYMERCSAHVRRLGIERVVTFEGPVQVAEALARVDVVVLTSISEAQPLVILEAYAAGLPVVATRVGAVPELLFGAPGEDAELGPSGIMTPIGAPWAAAQAWIELSRSPELRAQLGAAGAARVRRFYRGERMVAAYRALYHKYGAEAKGGR
ncbi:MAG: GT4 family glycosyltransferase PelF [Planctomycetota bacterium]